MNIEIHILLEKIICLILVDEIVKLYNIPTFSGCKDHIPMTEINSDICIICNNKRDEHHQ